VVLISVVYYSEWRERGREEETGVRGGVLEWRRRSAVMRETEEEEGGRGEGDQESGREDRRR